MNLNPSQYKAVSHGSGPMLVLAGPGSGKTHVIVSRIKYLIEHLKVHPEEILVVTFSRAAADEMQLRFLNSVNAPPMSRVSVTFGTFHGIFFSILKDKYGLTNKNIITSREKFQIITSVLEKYQTEFDDPSEDIPGILSEISYMKNNAINAENYISTSIHPDIFRDIFTEYKKEMRIRKLIDFDDMLITCCKLLYKDTELLESVRRKYRYILIDEFQDINRVQYETIKLISGREKNLFVVGDDDQSIYGFRGSDPEIMARFLNDFKEAEKILLNTNYRCSKKILEKSLKLVSANKNRIMKKLNAGRNEEGSVELLAFSSQEEEFDHIVQKLKQKQNRPVSYDPDDPSVPYTQSGCPDTAILFRSSFDASLLLQKLSAADIPFVINDRQENVFEHFIARDMFAYIRTALGTGGKKDLLRIVNKPSRYISRESISDMRKFYFHNRRMMARIDRFEEDLKFIASCSPFAAIKYIRKAVGYDDYLKEFSKDRGADLSSFYDVLDAIEESAKGFCSFEQWFDLVEKYSEDISGCTNKNPEKNAVKIMTMHSSKGLEFDTVYLPCVNDRHIPHKKARSIKDIEEERRLFYVAMTRAKNRLFISWSGKIKNKLARPSDFLKDL